MRNVAELRSSVRWDAASQSARRVESRFMCFILFTLFALLFDLRSRPVGRNRDGPARARGAEPIRLSFNLFKQARKLISERHELWQDSCRNKSDNDEAAWQAGSTVVSRLAWVYRWRTGGALREQWGWVAEEFINFDSYSPAR